MGVKKCFAVKGKLSSREKSSLIGWWGMGKLRTKLDWKGCGLPSTTDVSYGEKTQTRFMPGGVLATSSWRGEN